MKQFFSTFKTKQETNTLVNRERIIRNHIQPIFGKKRLDRISTNEQQAWLNETQSSLPVSETLYTLWHKA